MNFHDEDSIVPQDAPDKHLLRTHAVTLFLDTQKNCVRGESTAMEATDLEHGNTVSAAACHFST